MPKGSNIGLETARIPPKKHNLKIFSVRATTFQSSTLLCIADWGKNHFNPCYLHYYVGQNGNRGKILSRKCSQEFAIWLKEMLCRDIKPVSEMSKQKSSTHLFFSICLLSRGFGNFTFFTFHPAGPWAIPSLTAPWAVVLDCGTVYQ